MRILWVGKSGSGDSGAGDEVYDRKLLQRLELSHDIIRFVPEPLSRPSKLLNLALGVPLYRATYRSHANIMRLRTLIRETNPNVVAISWEPFDFFAAVIDKPVVLLLHNITSDAILEVFYRNFVAKWYARKLSRYEEMLYNRANISSVVVLSVRDADVARGLVKCKPVIVVSPGAPPVSGRPDNQVRPELIISGTYDWYPKRRDLVEASEEFRSAVNFPLSLFWDKPLPKKARTALEGIYLRDVPQELALRFGFVPDKFSSGFKLKVTYYIVNNCIVLSKSDVSQDYEGIADFELFIRRVNNVAEIEEIYKEISRMDPIQLINRFEVFKQACVKRFSWDEGAERVSALLESAAMQRS